MQGRRNHKEGRGKERNRGPNLPTREGEKLILKRKERMSHRRTKNESDPDDLCVFSAFLQLNINKLLCGPQLVFFCLSSLL